VPRRSKGIEGIPPAGFLLLLALAAVLYVVGQVAAILLMPEFWIFSGVIVAIFLGFKAWGYYWEVIWPKKYFASEEFLAQKQNIESYVDECNDLNDHIAELKSLQDEIYSSNRGRGTHTDTSAFNFQRRSWSEKNQGSKRL